MVDTPIGIDSPQYTVDPTDIGTNIYCRVTATNLIGSTFATSNIVGPVTDTVGGDVPSNITAPAISGTIADGQVLSVVDDGEWTNSPTSTTYQWYGTLVDDFGSPLLDDFGKALGVAIFGARSSTYTIGQIPVAPESTWNEADNWQALVLSNNNLTAEAALPNILSISTYGAVRGNERRNTGRRWFEVTIDSMTSGYMSIGISDGKHANGSTPGYYNYNGGIAMCAPTDSGGFVIAQQQAFLIYDPGHWTSGDVLGFGADFSTRNFWVSRNGVFIKDAGGNWGGAPDEVGVTPANWGVQAGAMVDAMPYLEMNTSNSPTMGKATLNTTGPFVHLPTGGFIAWSEPN
jgi:hypothetical protein